MRFSPSQTEDWLFCPMKRWLNQRWEPKYPPERRTVAAQLGTEVSAGLSVAYGGNGESQKIWETASADAKTLVDKVIQAKPIPADWTILGTELVIDESGARPDLIARVHGEGPPCPVVALDWKVRRNYSRYEQKEMKNWRHSWKMLHYASVLNSPRWYIGLIIPYPFNFRLLQFTPDPEEIRQWRAHAEQVWAQMAEDDLNGGPRWQAARHQDEYGECDYALACLDLMRDESLMKTMYKPREKRKSEWNQLKLERS